MKTVGELEVIDHVGEGQPLVDTRLEHFYREGRLPGTRPISHKEMLDRRDELDHDAKEPGAHAAW